ncbi:MAG TPA: hypothetical protein PK147_12660, partial [Saprospiraceae bacterium]|nr:hypothetical protein [Saprospiraceae bacterium]
DTDPGVITTRFVDESPSMDNFTGTTEVLDKYSQFGLAINFHFGRYQGLSHSIFFDINFGDAYSYIFGYSIGYSIPIALGDSYLHIRPALGLMVGNQGFKLGELDNNAGYIEINGNQYFGSYLNMDLKTQSFLYGPQLDLRYFISDNFNIHGNVAYDIGSQDGVPSLYFTSPSTADETFNAEKEINTDNPYVDYNGEKLEKLPYNIGGLRFGIGVGYIWNKD